MHFCLNKGSRSTNHSREESFAALRTNKCVCQFVSSIDDGAYSNKDTEDANLGGIEEQIADDLE